MLTRNPNIGSGAEARLASVALWGLTRLPTEFKAQMKKGRRKIPEVHPA